MTNPRLMIAGLMLLMLGSLQQSAHAQAPSLDLYWYGGQPQTLGSNTNATTYVYGTGAPNSSYTVGVTVTFIPAPGQNTQGASKTAFTTVTTDSAGNVIQNNSCLVNSRTPTFTGSGTISISGSVAAGTGNVNTNTLTTNAQS